MNRLLVLLAVIAGAGSCNVDVVLGGKQCDVEHPCSGAYLCVDAACVATTDLRACINDNGCGAGEECQLGYCLPTADVVDAGGAKAKAKAKANARRAWSVA